MIIRHAAKPDLDALAKIEAASYPPAEGASRQSIARRLAVFPECFWILEEDGSILAFINGMATGLPDLTDEMYDRAEMHDPNGDWLMLFSVVTAPAHRHKGYAQALMERVIADSRGCRRGIVLTCKEKLLGFYGQFGYQNEGLSASTHGKAAWYQMRLTF